MVPAFGNVRLVADLRCSPYHSTHFVLRLQRNLYRAWWTLTQDPNVCVARQLNGYLWLTEDSELRLALRMALESHPFFRFTTPFDLSFGNCFTAPSKSFFGFACAAVTELLTPNADERNQLRELDVKIAA